MSKKKSALADVWKARAKLHVSFDGDSNDAEHDAALEFSDAVDVLVERYVVLVAEAKRIYKDSDVYVDSDAFDRDGLINGLKKALKAAGEL